MHYGGHLVDREAWRKRRESKRTCRRIQFARQQEHNRSAGGMTFTRAAPVLGRVRQMRTIAMTSSTQERLEARTPSMMSRCWAGITGWMSLGRAVGLVQLQSIRNWDEQRGELVRTYREILIQRCPSVAVAYSDELATAWDGALLQ